VSEIIEEVEVEEDEEEDEINPEEQGGSRSNRVVKREVDEDVNIVEYE